MNFHVTIPSLESDLRKRVNILMRLATPSKYPILGTLRFRREYPLMIRMSYFGPEYLLCPKLLMKRLIIRR